ncbi:hypothetical protein D3C81_1814640 [compost metagenome]
MFVERWRHKRPHLVQNHRRRRNQRDPEGQLDWRKERRCHIGGNHRCTQRHLLNQRRGDNLIDVVSEIDQAQENQENGNNAV